MDEGMQEIKNRLTLSQTVDSMQFVTGLLEGILKPFYAGFASNNDKFTSISKF